MDSRVPNNFKVNSPGLLPREEFRAAGRAAGMTSERLLAILLKTGAPGCDVLELSRRLIAAFGGTGHLVRADLDTLKTQITRYNKAHPDRRILGIGEAKRMELAAAFELVRREYVLKDDVERRQDVHRTEDRYRVFRRVLKPEDRQEKFCVLMLDGKLHPLGDPLIISKGTLDGTAVHPREVFQEAIRWGAYAVMVAHNHPSGDPTPSEKDVSLTRKLLEVSHLIAIPLLDHLVLGAVNSDNGRGYVSMREACIVDFRGLSNSKCVD